MQKLWIAAVVSIAVLTNVAAAQTADSPRMSALLLADANHDGTITRAEYNTMRAAEFTHLDADHDGKLSASEAPHWGAARTTPASGAPRVRGDANHDGSVSRAEYDQQGTRMFRRLDADHNGSITQAEIIAARTRAQQHHG